MSESITLDDFIVPLDKSKSLGKGTFGEVFKGKNSKGKVVAVKQIKLDPDNDGDKKGSDAMTEIKNFQKLEEHPNLVKMFDFHFAKNSFWVVMEFCDLGDLNVYVLTTKPDMRTQVNLMRQMADGLAHMHTQDTPVVHRDLKPANIMMISAQGQPRVKITDFGLSKIADQDPAKMAETYMMSTQGGSPAFMAPELFIPEKYTASVDVFALGLVFLAVLKFRTTALSGKFLKPVAEGPMAIMGLIPIGTAMCTALQSQMPITPVCMTDNGKSPAETTVRKLIAKMACARKDDRLRAWQVKQVLEKLDADPKTEADVPNKKAESAKPPAAPKPVPRPAPAQVPTPRPPSATVPNGVDALSALGALGGQNSELGDIGYQLLREAVEQFQRRRAEGMPDESDRTRVVRDVAAHPFNDLLGGDNQAMRSMRRKYRPGEKVRIEPDEARVKRLQKDHGGFNESMRLCLGQIGTVKENIFHITKVKFPGGQEWSFNPDLLLPPEALSPARPPAAQTFTASSPFQRFDIVQIPEDESVVKSLQDSQEYGGWNDRMKMSLGSKGIVNRIGRGGQVHVECINGDDWGFNPELLIKVDTSEQEVEAGDVVLINHDRGQVEALQEGHGGWIPNMENCLGHTAIVKQLVPGNRVRIEVGTDLWVFNKDAVKVVAKSEELMMGILRRMMTRAATSYSS